MLAFPNAKINIGLNVTRKRSDGFHDILSCFYPVPWCDALEIIEGSEFKFIPSGNEIPGNAEDNICVKAYELLREEYQLPPVHIHLHKVIPTGAGLGGGSSDGAFTLKLLNDKFELGLSQTQLESFAKKLGSDCPFFISNTPVIASGTGTDFEPIELPLSGFHLVLVNPGIHISTKEAYSKVTYSTPPTGLKSILSGKVSTWKDVLINDFERALFPDYPEISQLKEKLYQMGALYASMTGSGSTVFGIFDGEQEDKFPGNYEVFQTRLD